MPTMNQEQRAELKDKVCDILEVDPNTVADDTQFSDLGVDSMLTLEIMALLDKDYSLNLDNSALAKMTDMNGIFALVEEAGD